MFEQLTERFGAVFKKLKSRGKLHPKQVDAALEDIRAALLEADVAVEVADSFLDRVRARSVGEEVMRSVTPGQQVVKIVGEELTETLGGKHRPFVLPSADPAVVMMAGLQGSGKTTACAKLALHLREKGRRPMLVAADLQRPAAVEQLVTLGQEIDVPVATEGRDPVKVAKGAVKRASKDGRDVLIVDTAGRLHVDREMMREAGRVRAATRPHQPEVRKLGPLRDLLGMLPGGAQMASNVQLDEGQVGRAEAIISSMTPEERRNPAIIGGSRRSRIARGSGTSVGDVNVLLKQFDEARKMMKRLTGGRLPKLPGMPRIPGT